MVLHLGYFQFRGIWGKLNMALHLGFSQFRGIWGKLSMVLHIGFSQFRGIWGKLSMVLHLGFSQFRGIWGKVDHGGIYVCVMLCLASFIKKKGLENMFVDCKINFTILKLF